MGLLSNNFLLSIIKMQFRIFSLFNIGNRDIVSWITENFDKCVVYNNLQNKNPTVYGKKSKETDCTIYSLINNNLRVVDDLDYYCRLNEKKYSVNILVMIDPETWLTEICKHNNNKEIPIFIWKQYAKEFLELTNILGGMRILINYNCFCNDKKYRSIIAAKLGFKSFKLKRYNNVDFNEIGPELYDSKLEKFTDYIDKELIELSRKIVPGLIKVKHKKGPQTREELIKQRREQIMREREDRELGGESVREMRKRFNHEKKEKEERRKMERKHTELQKQRKTAKEIQDEKQKKKEGELTRKRIIEERLREAREKKEVLLQTMQVENRKKKMEEETVIRKINWETKRNRLIQLRKQEEQRKKLLENPESINKIQNNTKVPDRRITTKDKLIKAGMISLGKMSGVLEEEKELLKKLQWEKKMEDLKQKRIVLQRKKDAEKRKKDKGISREYLLNEERKRLEKVKKKKVVRDEIWKLKREELNKKRDYLYKGYPEQAFLRERPPINRDVQVQKKTQPVQNIPMPIAGKRMLVITEVIPRVDLDSGSNGVFNLLCILAKNDFHVTLLPVRQLASNDSSATILEQSGVRCFCHGEIPNAKEYLQHNSTLYDFIKLTQFTVADEYYNFIKNNTRSKIIFDTLDLCFLRTERRYDIEGTFDVFAKMQEVKKRELEIISGSNLTIVINEFEKETLVKELGDGIRNKISVIPLIIETPDLSPAKPFSERKDICFIGNYLHPPNVDAVNYFINNILVGLISRIPNVKFKIVGSHMPREFKKKYQHHNIDLVGYVDSLGDVLHDVKLCVSPLRWGAGSKGKIGSSMSYGVPCIATELSVEGMGLTDGYDILVVDKDDPVDDFIEKICQVYYNKGIWDKLSENSRKSFIEKFSVDGVKNIIKNDLLVKLN